MLVELSIIPVRSERSWADQLAEALELIDASGLPYQLTPSGTCIEGEWDEVMGLVRRCHEKIRESSDHVVTTVKVEDEWGASNQLATNISNVEEKAGRPLRRMAP